MAPIKYTGLCKPWRLSADLQAIVGTPTGSRVQMMSLLWKYIRNRHLQDPRDRRYFYPDYRMVKVFGYGRLRIMAMAKFLTPHLTALE